MERPLPKTDPPEIDPAQPRLKQDGSIKQVRRYKLITPLFGGGVNPAEADPVTIITGKAVRGQLRFWWRACRGSQFSSIEAMKQVEDLIWGSTENPSAVVIDLLVDRKGKEEIAYWAAWNQGRGKLETKSSPKIAPYAAFPLQPDKDEQKQKGWISHPVIVEVWFTLRLSFPKVGISTKKSRGNEAVFEVPELEKEVSAALLAWETFGGIGARTRRGFGALSLISVNGEVRGLRDLADARNTIDGILALSRDSGGKESVRGIPRLHNAQLKLVAEASVEAWRTRLIQTEREAHARHNRGRANPEPFAPVAEAWNTVEGVWQYLIAKLKDFRQSRSGGGRGRSKWPEPDEIRFRAHQSLPAHSVPVYSGMPLFPRAMFGLPITFPFHHNQSNRGRPHHPDRDPAKTKLTRAKDTSDRWASPLILRPLEFADGKTAALALVLNSPLPSDLRLIYEDTRDEVLDYMAADPGIKNPYEIEVEPSQDDADEIGPLNGETDVLKAFLKTLG